VFARIDERFAAAPSLETKRQLVTATLQRLAEIGHHDSVLVWRAGNMLGGLQSENVLGGFIQITRTEDTPLFWTPTLGNGGIYVVRVSWNSHTSRVEWYEHMVETRPIPGSKRNSGIYHCVPSPDFYELLTAEIEELMIGLLRTGEQAGSELERHMLRCLYVSNRSRPGFVEQLLRRMRPPLCVKELMAALRAIETL